MREDRGNDFEDNHILQELFAIKKCEGVILDPSDIVKG